jgi:hypothetical protein
MRFVPKNKGVVLGLISTKNSALESIVVLTRRTEEAGRFVDLDRLAIRAIKDRRDPNRAPTATWRGPDRGL